MDPPQPERRSDPPPDLNDDVLAEIFFRIPPDDPAVLVRLSVVCKQWRRLLTDPDFLRCYRVIHGSPPILGFFCEAMPRMAYSSFLPTTAFRPTVPRRSDSYPYDSRHGRALFNGAPPTLQILVSDNMTGTEWTMRAPELWRYFPRSAAVLCAVDGCNHLNCHDGPFRVALVTTDSKGTTHAAVYSSETDAWSDPASIDHPGCFVQLRRPSLLVGNALYFLCYGDTSIVEFDTARMTLAVIPSPPLTGRVVDALLVTAEGGGLGFAAVLDRSSLHQWSKDEAMDQWKHCGVKELEPLLPRGAISLMTNLIGFADGVRVIVVRTHAGVFTIELGSNGRAKMVSTRSDVTAAFPFMSFCTPDHSRGRLPPP